MDQLAYPMDQTRRDAGLQAIQEVVAIAAGICSRPTEGAYTRAFHGRRDAPFLLHAHNRTGYVLRPASVRQR